MNENAIKLVKALRSGDYKQTQRTLHRITDHTDGPAGYCCMGVAVKLYLDEHPDSFQIKESPRGGVIEYVNDDGGRHFSVPPTVVRDWLGFEDHNGTYNDGEKCLTGDNDRGATFEEIADTIESEATEPTGLFRK